MSEETKTKTTQEIKNTDGEVIFKAEISCREGCPYALKIGLAVIVALKEGANLRSANLRSADLRLANLQYANLRSANLRSANLRSADLRSADLRSADLRLADLRSADLRSANLRSANLRSADLRSADLRSADLRLANLRSADLRSADLQYANLRSANLRSANLRCATGNNHELKSFQLGTYLVCISKTDIAIGCEQHTAKEWKEFTDEQIKNMDGQSAVEWWSKWRGLILQVHSEIE